MKRLFLCLAGAALAILPLVGIGQWGLLAAAPVPNPKPAAYPAWWFERELIKRTSPPSNAPAWPGSYPPADDFAALNQGQLKTFALAAFDELEAKLAPIGGAGTAATNLVKNWCVVDPATGLIQRNAGQPVAKIGSGAQDFLAVNLGQLKNVAEPFYARLVPLGIVTARPWAGATDDFAMANIGQAKAVFSFVVATGDPNDTDGDGLPDSWETWIQIRSATTLIWGAEKKWLVRGEHGWEEAS